MAKKWLSWLERAFFVLFGLACFGLGITRILQSDVGASATLFAFGFLSFLYSNVTRFKRFKGLGFEAELWEDKQKEAEDLIERLKNVVTIYTREIVMGQVMAGRWVGTSKWRERFKLFDELVTQHDQLGQKIDFSDLKSRIQKIMIFDGCSQAGNELRLAVSKANGYLSRTVQSKFGSPIRDTEGYNEEIAKLREITFDNSDLFERVQSENIGQSLLASFREAKDKAQEYFGYTIEEPTNAIDDLEYLSALYERVPFETTEAVINTVDEIIDRKRPLA